MKNYFIYYDTKNSITITCYTKDQIGRISEAKNCIFICIVLGHVLSVTGNEKRLLMKARDYLKSAYYKEYVPM